MGCLVIYSNTGNKDKNEILLEKALYCMEKYYDFYNLGNYTEIERLLAPQDKSIPEMLSDVKTSRGRSGRYIGYKYPDNVIKFVQLPDEDNLSESESLKAKRKWVFEFAKKYGRDVFEDRLCLKNSFMVEINKDDNSALINICITQKYENGELADFFTVLSKNGKLGIVRVPLFNNW